MVGDVELRVWVADEPRERRQGLSGMESLPDGVDGMLFSWEQAGLRSFHMRDTPMHLDIWWFDAEGRLVGMDLMTPCDAEPCPSYLSPGPIRHALETPAGEWALPAGGLLSSG